MSTASHTCTDPTRYTTHHQPPVVRALTNFRDLQRIGQDNGYRSDGDNGGADQVDKTTMKKQTSSDMIKCFGPGLQSMLRKSKPKYIIEQLLMQETYSREECDRLIEIIKSRVVDHPTMNNGVDGTPTRATDANVSHNCTVAIVEAKKWLQEKKWESGSLARSGGGNLTMSPILQQGIGKEEGSPVDVAKSYMKARPPWASPSSKLFEFRSPSSSGIQLFNEGTPLSLGNHTFSSSKKRSFSSTGSWNIQEELRRVRSKATEDMLRTLSSSKIDVSALTLKDRTSQTSLAEETIDVTLDGLQNKASTTCPTNFAYNENQADATQTENESDAFKIDQSIGHLASRQDNGEVVISGTTGHSAEAVSDPVDLDGIKDNDLSEGQQLDLAEEEPVQDLTSHDRNCAALLHEAVESRAKSIPNGLPSSEPSSTAGEADNRQSDGEPPDSIGATEDECTTRTPAEESCELPSETSVDVPLINEISSMKVNSEKKSSKLNESLLQNSTRTNLKRSTVGRRTTSRNSKKIAGRGK
ncbi:hypothetical protein RJ641_001711 [Dillenia turbinata]|uniref:Protein KAKU4 n=1 Tax=Dillenia turbinata TaxID=194707 RepID=A0AAN8ZBT6_9MAGN